MENRTRELVLGKVMDLISAAGGNRLVVFKSPGNADLCVERRADYKADPHRLTVTEFLLPKTAAIADFPEISADSNDKRWFLFVYFDLVTQKVFHGAWLVPCQDFLGLAERGTRPDGSVFLRFSSSVHENNDTMEPANDKYRPFWIDISSLGSRFF